MSKKTNAVRLGVSDWHIIDAMLLQPQHQARCSCQTNVSMQVETLCQLLVHKLSDNQDLDMWLKASIVFFLLASWGIVHLSLWPLLTIGVWGLDVSLVTLYASSAMEEAVDRHALHLVQRMLVQYTHPRQRVLPLVAMAVESADIERGLDLASITDRRPVSSSTVGLCQDTSFYSSWLPLPFFSRYTVSAACSLLDLASSTASLFMCRQVASVQADCLDQELSVKGYDFLSKAK